MGLRPYRSDKFPQTGAKQNCISEYDAINTPNCQPCGSTANASP